MESLKTNNLVVHNAEIINGEGNLLFPSFYILNHTQKYNCIIFLTLCILENGLAFIFYSSTIFYGRAFLENGGNF